jgi:hypothetical protein
MNIYSVLKNLKKKDIVSDGVRKWIVVDSELKGDDCTIAVPYKWTKKCGDSFELWGDAQSKVSEIKNLKKVSK